VTLLALETATDRASVAVGRSEADAVEMSVSGARRHAASLLPMVAAVLTRSGGTLDDLTAVVLSDGPGSFTGLRVGAAVAKALVQARGLRFWTAPSLLVRAAGTGTLDATILAVSDALRGDIYAAAYRFVAGSIVTELAPTVCRPEDLESRLPHPSLIVGDVPPGARQLLEQWSGRTVVPSPAGAPDARHLLGLVGRTGGAREITPAAEWEPEYGRPAEAQARWETTHGRSLPHSAGSTR
jgi:tRNA threonylcarbamoyladenosine biosynthesis protein TsaB